MYDKSYIVKKTGKRKSKDFKKYNRVLMKICSKETQSNEEDTVEFWTL